MSRPNRCIKDENGEEVWISRSTVVIPIVFRLDKETDEVYTLVEKRGPTVSHTGEWCCPCGYIDWDETLEEACRREVEEETGLTLDLSKIRFFDINTNKYSKMQSIDVWYECWTDSDFDMEKVETKDEILDLQWLKVGHIEYPQGYPFMHISPVFHIHKKDIYEGKGKWAFKNHHKTMIQMLGRKFNGDGYIVRTDE